MADETEIKSPATSQGADVAPATSAPSYDPAELEYLRNFHASARPVVEKIAPIYDDIAGLVDDPKLLDLYRSARESYTTLQQRQAPEIPSWAKEQGEKLAKLTEFTETLSRQQAMAALQNTVATLGQKYPKLADNNYELVGKLAKDAADAGLTDKQFVDYLTRTASYFSPQAAAEAARAERPTPPASLRNDASVAGAPQTKSKISSRRDLVRDLSRKLRAGGM